MQYRFQSGGKVYAVSLERLGPGFQAVIDGISYQVEVLDEKPGQLSLLFNGSPTVIYWAVDGANTWVSLEGCTYLLEKPSSQTVPRTVEAGR